MNVQPRRKDRIKIGHFLSVLFRRAGNIRSTTKGEINDDGEKSRDQSGTKIITGNSQEYHSKSPEDSWDGATANMMRFVWVFLSCFFQVSFRFLLACWKVSPV